MTLGGFGNASGLYLDLDNASVAVAVYGARVAEFTPSGMYVSIRNIPPLFP